MNTVWFKTTRWFYMPVSLMGVVVTVLAIVFLIPIYAAVIRNGHSVSDDLYNLFVYTSCTAFWLKLVAEKTSEQMPIKQ